MCKKYLNWLIREFVKNGTEVTQSDHRPLTFHFYNVKDRSSTNTRLGSSTQVFSNILYLEYPLRERPRMNRFELPSTLYTIFERDIKDFPKEDVYF